MFKNLSGDAFAASLPRAPEQFGAVAPPPIASDIMRDEPLTETQQPVAHGGVRRHPVLYGRVDETYTEETDGTRHEYAPRELVIRNQPGFRLSDLPQPQAQVLSYPEDSGTAAPVAESGEAPPPPGPRGDSAEPEAPAEQSETPADQPEAQTDQPEAPAEQPETPADQPETKEEPGKETGAPAKGEDTAKPEKAAQSKAADTPLTPAEKVAKEVKNRDAERIKQMRQQGNWFYNPDGTPMTNEELDGRLASGDIEGIKSVDRYQNAWDAAKDYTIPEGEETQAPKK